MASNQFTELPHWLEANRSCKHVHLVYFLCVHPEQFLRHFHHKLSKKCKKVDRIQSCATCDWDSLHSLGLSVWVFSISRRRCHSIMGTSCALWEAATLACNKLSSTLRTYELGASKLGKTVPESMASIFSGAMYDVSFLPAWCEAAAFKGRSSPCLESNLHARLVDDVKGNPCIRERQEHVRDGGRYLWLRRPREALLLP